MRSQMEGTVLKSWGGSSPPRAKIARVHCSEKSSPPQRPEHTPSPGSDRWTIINQSDKPPPEEQPLLHLTDMTQLWAAVWTSSVPAAFLRSETHFSDTMLFWQPYTENFRAPVQRQGGGGLTRYELINTRVKCLLCLLWSSPSYMSMSNDISYRFLSCLNQWAVSLRALLQHFFSPGVHLCLL